MIHPFSYTPAALTLAYYIATIDVYITFFSRREVVAAGEGRWVQSRNQVTVAQPPLVNACRLDFLANFGLGAWGVILVREKAPQRNIENLGKVLFICCGLGRTCFVPTPGKREPHLMETWNFSQ